MTTSYADNVFINCPYDAAYRPLLDLLVFTVHDCGLVARTALEVGNASQLRFDKIVSIITECRFGIHDLSRMELEDSSGLARLNMAFELGLFLGAQRFGEVQQQDKFCVVLDTETSRYHRTISDLSGVDIRPYQAADPRSVIRAVRDPLASALRNVVQLPGPKDIARRYEEFTQDLPAICEQLYLSPDELEFFDFANIVAIWLLSNTRPGPGSS